MSSKAVIADRFCCGIGVLASVIEPQCIQLDLCLAGCVESLSSSACPRASEPCQ
jgi:hypothetical protein